MHALSSSLRPTRWTPACGSACARQRGASQGDDKPWGAHLQLLQADLLLAHVLQHEVAGRLDAPAVVLHVQGDGPPSLGAAAHVVELEAHEGLHQGCARRMCGRQHPHAVRPLG